MMSNVIKADFKKPLGDEGYYVQENSDISGAFMENLGANLNGDNVYIGKKTGTHTIENPVILTKTQMNRFCQMWLALHDPNFRGDNNE